jgi:hypothetical protein
MAKPQGRAKLQPFAAAVARGAHLAIAKDALDALDRAEQRGVPFEDAQREIVASLRADWTTAGSPRVKLTADNAVTQAMQLGRVTALRSPDVAKRRPYWVFSAVLDDQTTETCIDCDGVVLPVGHAWWATHTPSLHLRCFPPGTIVETERGGIPIEALAVGDKVLTHLGRYRSIVEFFVNPAPDRLVKLSLRSGGQITATGNHPALTDRGWVEFSGLRVGDRLFRMGQFPAKRSVIVDGNDGDAGGKQSLNSIGRHALPILGHLNAETDVREIDVYEVEPPAGHDGVLELGDIPKPIEPCNSRGLRARWLGVGHPMPVRVFQEDRATSSDGLADRIGGQQPAPVYKFLRGARDTWVRLFRVTLGPMLAAISATVAEFGHHVARHLAPRLVAYPLGSYSIPAVSELYPSPFQHGGNVRRSSADLFCDLPERQLAHLVSIAEPFSKVASEAHRQDPFTAKIAFSHADIVSTPDAIVNIESVSSTSDFVYNIGVCEDESYVADGYVVHNCRSVIASCTEAQAKQLGITAKPPTVDVEEGFGRPGDLCEWEPRPGEYPAEVYDLIPMTDTTRRNDLGVSDVHVPTTARPRKTTMATLPTKKRNALPDTAFALPETRQFPIHDAAHVRNAAARLEQQKSALGPEKYAAAKRAIVRAAKRFGISTSLAPATKKKLRTPDAAPARRPMPGLGLRRGLRFRIGLMPGGGHQIDVMHAKQPSDGIEITMRTPCGELDIAALAKPWRDLAEAEARLDQIRSTSGTTVSEEYARLSAEAVTLRELAAKPVWIQLAKVGKFNGHPAGPFEMTPETFDEIVRNFNATVNRRIPIDFEHASEADCASGSIPQDGAPAQGWITQLDNRGLNGLWGLVEWLEPARTYIREGRYRFFSPAIRFGSRDRVSGKPIGARMTSGALTNSPFLDAMAPVTASDKPGATTMSLDKPMMSHDFMARMRAALRCGDTDTLEKMAAKCADLRDLCATMDDAMMSQGVDLKPYMTDLAGLMNMPAHTTHGELLDAVEAMINAAIERHEALYHEGGDEAAEEESEMNGTAPMNDKNNTDLAVTLGETKAALAVVTAEKAALMSEREKLTADNAGLTLRLNDATAKVAAAEQDKAALAAEVVALKEQIATRDAADAEAKVTAAFETYKDARKLTDNDKLAMRVVLKSDPALFAQLYPAVAASQQHLMRNLTGGRLATDQTTQMSGKIPANAMTITAVTEVVSEEQGAKMTGEQVSALTDRLMSEKKMSLKNASILAGNIAAGKAQNPFAN